MDAQGVLIAGRYRLRSRVGAGGMGVVWQGWDERLQRAVALKLLHRAPGIDEVQADLANQRVMREARITARLHHRYAVPVFDVVEYEGQACLVMPFLPSMTLAAVLREAGPLSIDEVGQVGGQISSALAAAHQAGIVHRDVKPGNILIIEDGTALISDFGIAHAFGEATLTATGLIHGTPAYLAPEVARGGEATYASDVFSFGATLYDALEGAPPFGKDQNSIALLHRIAAGNFESPKRAGRLTPILLQALDADPESRPSMAAVAQTISDLARAPEGPIGERVATSSASEVTPGEEPTTTPRPIAAAPIAAAPIEVTGATREMADADPDPSQSEPRSPQVDPQPSRTTPSRRRRWGLVLSLVGAVVIVGGAIMALLLNQDRTPDNATAGDSRATTSKPKASASTVTHASTRASTPASSAGPASRSPSPKGPAATSSSPSPSASSPSRHPTVRGTPTARELAQAVTSYYALVPDHTDQAWPRMTAEYQANHAGGRTGYENFWQPVRRVTADDVTGRPPDRAVATITYHYRDGRVVRERTTYQFVNDGGALKIADSRVVSSATS